MATQRMFETPDLHLPAAPAALLEVEPSYKVISGRTFCYFPLSEDLYKAMGLCNAGIQISAIQYAETTKRIGAEFIMRRYNGTRR